MMPDDNLLKKHGFDCIPVLNRNRRVEYTVSKKSLIDLCHKTEQMETAILTVCVSCREKIDPSCPFHFLAKCERPKWTKTELDLVSKKAKKLADMFKQEGK